MKYPRCQASHTYHAAMASSHGMTLAPFTSKRSSTSFSICSAVFPASSYVECAPESIVTLKPAASAPLQVDSTQHSLWMPNATMLSTPSFFNCAARPGLDSNVSPLA